MNVLHKATKFHMSAFQLTLIIFKRSLQKNYLKIVEKLAYFDIENFSNSNNTLNQDRFEMWGFNRLEDFVFGQFCVIHIPCSHKCHLSISGIHSIHITFQRYAKVYLQNVNKIYTNTTFCFAQRYSKAVYYITILSIFIHKTQFTTNDLMPWDSNLPSALFFSQTTNICTNIVVYSVFNKKNVIICIERTTKYCC